MRIKNLLLLGTSLIMSGVAMAQTTVTAGNVKLVSGEEARLSYYYTNSEAMGGFQMVVSLPDGVTLEEDAEKTAKGLSINGGEAATGATFFNVGVPSGFECIGVKADVNGTTSDGTAYKAGDILLVCFPVKAGAEYKATDTASRLCTLTLTTGGATEEVLETVKVNGFVGSDLNGTGGETTAQYVASAESVVAPEKAAKLGDINADGEVSGQDIQAEINAIVKESKDFKYDVNDDDSINGQDIQAVINVIVASD